MQKGGEGGSTLMLPPLQKREMVPFAFFVKETMNKIRFSAEPNLALFVIKKRLWRNPGWLNKI